MFGFTVYDSIEQVESAGKIPFPSPKDRMEGGHAAAAVDYDDKTKTKFKYGKIESAGAFFIRNSRRARWGEGGDGRFPDDYLLKGFAEDFWSVKANET